MFVEQSVPPMLAIAQASIVVMLLLSELLAGRFPSALKNVNPTNRARSLGVLLVNLGVLVVLLPFAFGWLPDWQAIGGIGFLLLLAAGAASFVFARRVGNFLFQ